MLASSPTQNAVKIGGGSTTTPPTVGGSSALSGEKVWDSRIWAACDDNSK